MIYMHMCIKYCVAFRRVPKSKLQETITRNMPKNSDSNSNSNRIQFKASLNSNSILISSNIHDIYRT